MKAEIILVMLVICALVFMATCMVPMQEKEIKDKVESIGGKLIMCEMRLVDHPFFKLNQEQAYYFEYMQNGVKKIGYVKFGLFDEWRLDQKE